VPGFEREVLQPSDRFFPGHRGDDHRAKLVECEVLQVAFFNKIDRSVDKRAFPRFRSFRIAIRTLPL
jgi:hypothetical protein